MDGHRHGPGPEHDFEPVRGLPEPLPAGERMLWQGAPDARALAVRAFHVRKVAVYFAAVAALQLASALADGDTPRQAAAGVATLAALAALAIGVLATIAWLSARSSAYTITDRRVVMRVGIVLTMTFNIPYSRIASAGVKVNPDGTADLPLALVRGSSIGWAHLWPHARPWRMARPEPMLRCVPDGLAVARLLAQAWSQATGGAVLPVSPQGGAAPRSGHLPSDGPAALAGR